MGVLGDVGPLHRGVCRHILQEKGHDMLIRKDVTLATIPSDTEEKNSGVFQLRL